MEYLLFVIAGLVLLVIAIIVAMNNNKKQDVDECPKCPEPTVCPEPVACPTCPEPTVCPEVNDCSVDETKAMLYFLKYHVFNNKVSDNNLSYITPHALGIIKVIKDSGMLGNIDMVSEIINHNMSIIFNGINKEQYKSFISNLYGCISISLTNTPVPCLQNMMQTREVRMFMFNSLKQTLNNIKNNYQKMRFPNQAMYNDFITEYERFLASEEYTQLNTMTFEQFNTLVDQTLTGLANNQQQSTGSLLLPSLLPDIPYSTDDTTQQSPDQSIESDEIMCPTNYDPHCHCVYERGSDYLQTFCKTYSNECLARLRDKLNDDESSIVAGRCNEVY